MEAGVIDSPLPVAIATTVYGRWGDVILLLLLVVTIAGSVIHPETITQAADVLASSATFAERGPVSGEKQLRALIMYIKS